MRTTCALGTFMAMAALIMVTGCREDEQNRILVYDKGTYLGAPDSALTEETKLDLRDRARQQADAFGVTSAGGGAPPASVRPPADSEAGGELRTRTLNQSFN